MMTQRGRKKRSGFKIIILFFVILFLVLNYFKVTPFHSTVMSFSVSALKTKDSVFSPFNNFFSYFSSKKSLENESDELKKQISDLKLETLSNEILKYEYKTLLQQVDKSSEDQKIAKVLFKPPYSSFNNLIISSQKDISIGEKVFYQNIILGEVVEINSQEAIVKLYSSSGHKSVSKLNNGNEFEVVGKGSGQYEMVLPKDVEILENDPVIYPAEEIVLFGIINTIFATEDDLFNKVLFNIPVDFADINYVQVGKPVNILEE
jgi:cell shape-determining protein MreC